MTDPKLAPHDRDLEDETRKMKTQKQATRF